MSAASERARKAQTALERASAGRPPDPLADLRTDDQAALPVIEGAGHGEPEPIIVDGLVTPEAQERARHVLVAAWHSDPITLGFLHRGENCGCWYISGITVGAILPIQGNAEPDDDGE